MHKIFCSLLLIVRLTNCLGQDTYYREDPNFSFKTLHDIGLGFNSKKEKTKWIAMFNSLRNNWAHEASKNNGLSKEEVALLKIMYSHCNKTSYNNVYSA